MPTTVATYTPNTGNGGDAGLTYRILTGPLSVGSSGQVRVTFHCGSGAVMWTDHCSIGVASAPGTGAGGTATVATPVELLFGGAHGMNVTNAFVTSDWTTFSFASTDTLVVIMDHHTPNTSEATDSTTGVAAISGTAYDSGASYNSSASGSAMPGGGIGRVEAITKIETQSAGGVRRTLLSLDGMGSAAGSFFANPLGRSMLGWRSPIIARRPALIVPKRKLAA